MENLKQQCAKLDPISESYIKEALHTYQAGCFKATAVMIGTAAEGAILHLRDVIVKGLRLASQTPPKELEGWKIKAVCDEVTKVLEDNQKHMPKDLSDEFDVHWSAFEPIRAIRNRSGHPNSIEPVTLSTVHAALLTFPQFMGLVANLEAWVVTHPF